MKKLLLLLLLLPSSAFAIQTNVMFALDVAGTHHKTILQGSGLNASWHYGFETRYVDIAPGIYYRHISYAADSNSVQGFHLSFGTEVMFKREIYPWLIPTFRVGMSIVSWTHYYDPGYFVREDYTDESMGYIVKDYHIGLGVCVGANDIYFFTEGMIDYCNTPQQKFLDKYGRWNIGLNVGVAAFVNFYSVGRLR